jgi:ubiquinone/menaquinone biosynthesis C-methylase UbiE
MSNKTVNTNTVSSYSNRGSTVYEDPMNKNFLYGKITIQFLEQISFRQNTQSVLDIGCGTGFGFDVLYDTFKQNNMSGIGIEPADGMLQIAIDKYGDDAMFSFDNGSFENIALEDNSVDQIISTLALHWVKSLDVAAAEMKRVLKPGGQVDILMIAKDDGAQFKKAIVEAQRKHLTFGQIMKTALLVQRATPDDVKNAFQVFGEEYDVDVIKHTDVTYGSFEDHMTWWKARSSPVIAEVEDKDAFILDLKDELEKLQGEKGIPFDSACYWISVRGK